MTSRVLITGANGFLGRALVSRFAALGAETRAATRDGRMIEGAKETVALGDLATLSRRPDDARRAVEGCGVVIHAAGLAHRDAGIDEAVYFAINTEATRALATAARDVGARFVFVSSIRAQVGASHPDVIDETTPARPVDAYGRSKRAAELALDKLTGLEATSVRPVLVYGPGAKGNLATLARAVRWPVPWPTGLLRAKRSVVARDDLVDALHCLATRPSLRHALYIAAHPEPISFTQMMDAFARARGGRCWQAPVPPSVLRFLLSLAGKRDVFERVGEPLRVNPARLMGEGWTPRRAFEGRGLD